MNEKKWYLSNWFVILMLIFIFPVGLFLMWYNKKWTKPARWIVTGLIALAVVISPFMEDEKSQSEEKTVSQDNKEEKTEKETSKDKAEPKKEEHKKEKSSDDSKTKSSKPLTDEDKLKKNIKDESVTLKDLEFVNDGDEIHITIEASTAMSKKSTLRVMKVKTADTLYALKKTKLNFSTVNVYVSPPDEEQYAMTSRWTYDDVKEIDEDSTYTLPDEMEEKADGFMLNSYFR